MGYNQRVFEMTCGHCKQRFCWTYKSDGKPPSTTRPCKCGATNYIKLPEWPDVPRALYVGSDNTKILKVYPFHPDAWHDKWQLPYSTRSFLYQASKVLGGCDYSCDQRGEIYGEPIFADWCSAPETREDPDSPNWNCHIMAGWAAGAQSCRLWESIAALCQTDTEKKFLWSYLRYVKDRQFPMLIPQVRVGIAERRRPDFVVYVPLQLWKFKAVAIELDGGHPESKEQDDAQRDAYYAEHKLEVLSLRPGTKGYFEEVKVLVEKIDIWMNLIETDIWEVAIEAEVKQTDHPEDELPF